MGASQKALGLASFLTNERNGLDPGGGIRDGKQFGVQHYRILMDFLEDKVRFGIVYTVPQRFDDIYIYMLLLRKKLCKSTVCDICSLAGTILSLSPALLKQNPVPSPSSYKSKLIIEQITHQNS